MAEAGLRGAQDALAQHAAMRVHEREGRVVADGAEIAEVVGDALELRHQRAQLDARAAVTSTPSAASTARAKAKRIGDGAVAGGARRQACAARSSVAPAISAFDALVHIAEPLLQPHHRLAIGGEAEMAGLDDAGMHRADRDLVQAFAFDREECIRRWSIGAGSGVAPADA